MKDIEKRVIVTIGVLCY